MRDILVDIGDEVKTGDTSKIRGKGRIRESEADPKPFIPFRDNDISDEK